jgi:hypothetical protein
MPPLSKVLVADTIQGDLEDSVLPYAVPPVKRQWQGELLL